MNRIFSITFIESGDKRSPYLTIDFGKDKWGMFLDEYETLEGVFNSSILFESIRDISSQILAGSSGTFLVESGIEVE